MRLIDIRIKSSLFALLICVCSYGQDSVIVRKKLPYEKKAGMTLVWVNLSGYLLYIPYTGDGTYNLTVSPGLGYYLSRNVEAVATYSLIYTKFGSLSAYPSQVRHQVSASLRYYPFKRLNFFFVESGILLGNYTAIDSSRSVQNRIFSSNVLIGFGVEMLIKRPKRQYVLNFVADYAIPFNNNYSSDFIRSLGFGIVLKR